MRRSKFQQLGIRFLMIAVCTTVLSIPAGVTGQTPTPTPTIANFTLYHNDPPSSGGIDTALIDLIGATSNPGDTIDFCMYNLDRNEIVNALIEAYDGGQGATVRVISDADYAYADEEHTQLKPAYQELADAGIPIHTNALSQTGSMHNKFVLFNNQSVWTGSWNATNSGTISDSNDALLINSVNLAQAYGTEFNEMWAGTYGSNKTDNTVHDFTIDGVSLENYFSPSDGVKAQILEEINAASSNIYFLMFSFTDSDIADAMVQKATGSPSIEVKGVFDKQQGQSAYSQLTHFTRNGVPVKLDSYSGLLHHKLIIIDRGGADPRVITGSYNLSRSAEDDNDENIVIIRSPGLADAYYNIFENIYTNHTEDPLPRAQGRLVLNEVLARGFFRFFNIGDPSNWGRSRDDEGSSPGEVNVVDTIPPQIIHTPVTDVLVGRPVYIHCEIKDNLYLYSAQEPTLHYRLVTEPPEEFTSVRMGALFDKYHSVIPAELALEVGENKIEYYITAKDASHNMGSSPPVNPSLHPYSVNVQEGGPLDKLIITEIMYDPPDSPESKYEWVEIYNSGSVAIPLNGWKFTDFDGTYMFPEEASIEPGEYQIICNDLASFNSAHPGVQSVIYEYGSASIGNIKLPNSWGIVTGTIALINPDDLIVHEVDYVAAWGAQNGSGPNKNTLEKLNPTGPDDETNWMFSMVRGGTPGEAASPHYIFTKYDTGGGQVVTRPCIWLDKTLINPQSSTENTVTISYRLDRECLVSVKIYNPPSWDTPPEDCYNGAYLVRTLLNSETRTENMDLGQPAHEEVWDGKDQDGDPVYGVCRVIVEAVDPANPELTCRTESDDSVAAASWGRYEPDEFNVMSHQMVSILYSLTKPAHVTLRFKYQLPGQTAWNYITLMDHEMCQRPAGSPAQVSSKSVHNSYLWDGTDNNGNYVKSAIDYKIDLEAKGDIYGNVVLSRGGRLYIPSLVISPRSFFDPYGGEEENISYVLSKDCNLTVKIVSPEGETVRTLLNNQAQSGGLQTLSWDGKDDEGALVDDGKYMVVVNAATDMGESCREVAESVVCKFSDPDWNPQQ